MIVNKMKHAKFPADCACDASAAAQPHQNYERNNETH